MVMAAGLFASAGEAQALSARPLAASVISTDALAPVQTLDGRRVVLPATPSSPTQVRDDVSRRIVTAPPGCDFVSVVGTRGAALCTGELPFWRSLSVADGSTASLGLAEGEAVSSVGARWLLLTTADPTAPVYLDPRTGRRRAAQLTRDGRETQDSDTSDLARLPTLLRGGVVQGLSSRRAIYPSRPLRRVRLRVGRQVRTIRARCTSPQGCTQLSFHDGVLSFTDGRSGGFAYLVARRQLRRIELPTGPAIPPVLSGVSISHTRRAVYLSASVRRDPRDPERSVACSAVLPAPQG